uniref:DUF192 domain-containing protein n=1 Tax=viral metagenome TaxID=1070528 RepID=A0A6C0BCF5_9ZZZZ
MKEGDLLSFRVNKGQGRFFKAELVQTEETRRQGLMFRDKQPHLQGMFFLFTDKAKRRSMWMMNMRFALDIVWLDGSLRIVSIIRGAQPCRTGEVCEDITSTYNAQHAIEFNAGDAKALGLEEGDHLKFLSAKSK